jgi:regulator of nonsense transcripts 3
MPPKVLQKNPDRSGAGVLPIPASVRAPPAPKPPAARLKLEIRRLPPGLTLLEFEEALGEEWKLGKGRVDWREYRQGKAKNVSKMPELSRCYVHLVKEDLVREFEAKFLGITFRDKAGTWKNNASAGGAPMLGFAMNQRVPLQQGKQRARADNRQGTIDQDAEYMAFLEAETQPIPKASAIDNANAEKKDEEGGKVKVKSTPLIEDLRERKANKAKAAASKAEKADRKGKGDAKGEESTPAATTGGKKGDKAKLEQAAKEVAKTATKQAAGKQSQNTSTANANANANNASQKAAQTPTKGRRGAAQQNAKATATAAAAAAAAATQTPPAQQTTPAGPAAQRGPAQRQRGNNAEGIKKMLQKDLGIKPKAAAADQAAQTGTAAAARAPANNQQTPGQPKTPAQTPKQQQQASNAGPPKAYLKHANPSQGMTEILIQQALAQFGEMNNVTIDPRKGTAIAVFKTQEGLKKAVQAKKVPVAKGAVEVIEFKDRNGGGAGAGAASGNNSNSNSNSNSANNNNNSSSNDKPNNAGGGGGGGGRGGFRNRGGRAGRGGNNNNSGAANANAAKGSGQAAAAG